MWRAFTLNSQKISTNKRLERSRRRSNSKEKIGLTKRMLVGKERKILGPRKAQDRKGRAKKGKKTWRDRREKGRHKWTATCPS